MSFKRRNNRKADAILLAVFLSLFTIFSAPAKAEPRDDLFDMSIEELMNVEIQGSSALTQTTRKLQPSTVTIITREQIAASGARSLDELLDIYVPNLQIQKSDFYFPSIGIRGISSVTADKLLILLNGKELNEHTNYGAISERDLPMLTDIHHIDVVRGPGSALYGVGALAGVINIITENAETFQGQQVTLRTGQIEEFYSAEYKMGKKFKDGSGLYIYTGIARNNGSPETYSDMDSVFPRDWGFVPDQEGYRTIPKIKLYGDYMNGPFELWARYTRGGTRFDKPMDQTADPRIHDPNFPADERFNEEGYQQITAGAHYTFEISDKFKVDASFSYDMFDHELYFGSGVNCAREDKYQTKVVATWTPNEQHSIALGASWLREFFGLRSPGYPGDKFWFGRYNPGCMSMIRVGIPWIFWDANGFPSTDANRMPRWTTDTVSVFGEWQWKICDQWTNFFGMRMDKNTFTDPMFSPRDTLIFTPTERDTLKAMFSRAVKLNFASEMYITAHPPGFWWLVPANPPPGEKTKPEVLYAYEVRYERQQTPNFWLAGSLFVHDHSIKGYTGEVEQQAGSPVGQMRSYGIELEGMYKKGKNEVILSHSYTRMYKFNPVITGNGTVESPYHYISQSFTSAPGFYGDDTYYGNELAYWSDHQTKLVVRRQIDDKLSVDGSLRIIWGYPGAKWYDKYYRDMAWNNWGWYIPKPSSSIFSGNMKLDLGLTYAFSKDFELRVDGYNLLGLIDDDYNQNLIINGLNVSARSSAPALGVSLKYTF
jgi:outer membrane receptor protein involved in Fe transport